MTVRGDCDQSEHVFLQNIPHLLVNTEFVFLFIFIIFIILIFNRYLNYIHYICLQCLNLLKQIYVRFLTNYVRFVPLLL